MMRVPDKNRPAQISVWIQEVVVVLGCMYFLLFRIHPVLTIESQPPVFLMNIAFLRDYLVIPGGMTDWLSALLMQCWISDVWASVILTVCFWLAALLTKRWIRALTGKPSIHTIHLIPVGLLLAYHSQYDIHFSMTLALILNVAVLNLFLRWAPHTQWMRTVASVVAALLLYWLTGGAFLVFVVLIGAGDLLKKYFVSGLAVMAFSGLLPYAAAQTLVLLPIKQAYVHNLPLEFPLEVWYTGYLLLGFFVIALIGSSFSGLLTRLNPMKKFGSVRFLWETVGTLLLVSGGFGLATASTPGIKQYVLKVNRAVREERWPDVLLLTKNCPNETPLVLAQSNLALYQTGKLLDSMFAYPQSKGAQGLLMNQTWSLAWPEDACDVTWRLGLVNESQHWAHEAVEHYGPTPELLRRLGMIYLVKGYHAAARRYLLNLKDVPFQSETADRLLRLNDSPTELSNDRECAFIQSVMPNEDLISRRSGSSPKLELLMKRNRNNKMAFEYLMAEYLLGGNLSDLVDHLPDFHELGYAELPRHVQEAVILYMAMNPDLGLDQLKRWVHLSTFNRFMEFRQQLFSHKGDRGGALADLKYTHGDTYWYYYMFIKAAPRPSENQNEFQ
jgi:hypothetical protein